MAKVNALPAQNLPGLYVSLNELNHFFTIYEGLEKTFKYCSC